MESLSAEDDVVEKADAHEFGGLLEALRDLPILAGRRRITAWVVMNLMLPLRLCAAARAW
jgi:hypothetical protein